MVEHTAVNRGVVGSSPTRGVSVIICILSAYNSKGNCIWRHSQVVRQRSATPLSPVQIWLAPLTKNAINLDVVRFIVFFLKKLRGVS